MRPNIDAGALPSHCLNCGAKGTQRHFIYGLAKNGSGKALPYCPLPDGPEIVTRQVAEKHGSALSWSGGWTVTGALAESHRGEGLASFLRGCAKALFFGGDQTGEATYVYHFYDKQGNLLYVGITSDTKRRWAQHAEDKSWWHLVARKERVLYPTREEAEKVEAHQIRTHRPMFNRAMNGWFR